VVESDFDVFLKHFEVCYVDEVGIAEFDDEASDEVGYEAQIKTTMIHSYEHYRVTDLNDIWLFVAGMILMIHINT
jgi:hypothetical protein